MKFSRFIFIFIALACSSFAAIAQNSFAIVIDLQSYDAAKTEVEAYSQAIEKQNGWKVEIVLDRWQVPDSIRAVLKEMHFRKKNPIVGCVFVGDIPVPMIRDAQHMSSAFKMDQKLDRRDSSIPSDRFYDDFSLKFTSLGKDEEKPWFYYSLTADSPQRLHPDIFSGRIRPTDVGGVSRYEKLRSFLRKATAMKLQDRPMSKMFYFSGQGYISESRVARIDEKPIYYEHFPWLRDGNRDVIGYMNQADQYPIKEKYMNELMRKDLDVAVLHHHGAPETEYLNGIPPIKLVKDAKEYIVRNLREHVYSAVQRGKNADTVKLSYMKRFDVPASWLEDALSDSLAVADSLYDAAFDLHLEDFKVYGYQPNVPVVMLDACYNGSFHLDDCIADEYIFQPGSTVAVIANTVNALQDKWSDQFLGLIAQGGCVGEIPRLSTYLESHLIGDPTFKFRTDGYDYDVEDLLLKNDSKTWKRLLKSGTADIQALSLHQLALKGEISSSKLLEILQTSEYGIVRMQALIDLADFRNDDFIKGVEIASEDGYEYLQRRSIGFMGESGDPRLIPAMMKVSIQNNPSDRVVFKASMALDLFPKDSLMAEFERQFDDPSVCYVKKDSVKKVIARVIDHSSYSADELRSFLEPDSNTSGEVLNEKQRKLVIRSLRNNFIHYLVPQMIDYIHRTDNENEQLMLIEAFGWHPNSYQAEAMYNAAKEISEDPEFSQAVRYEASKTCRRLKDK